jgi:hypothetical protein
MEGVPKNNENNSLDKENAESLEKLTESIEQAKELYGELLKYNGTELVGAEAMKLNAEIESKATTLHELLKTIPTKECIENNLPWHPTDEKPVEKVTPMPAEPDYPTPANDDDYRIQNNVA